jgi:feruloyl esterase
MDLGEARATAGSGIVLRLKARWLPLVRSAAVAAVCLVSILGGRAHAAEPSAAARAPDKTCLAFKAQFSAPFTTVQSVEFVPAGSFKPPVGGALNNMPAFCRIVANVSVVPTSNVGVEIWLPTSGWNGKFQSIGTHGFGGQLYYADMASQLRRGYAISSSDIGHRLPAARGAGEFFVQWAYGHPQVIIDYAWRATHTQTIVSKAAITAYYGQPPRYSYFNGCSKGGSQGLQEAQMFPNDYDGIIAGGAVANFSGATAWHLWLAQVFFGNSGIAGDPHYIDPKKFPLITAAVLKACDKLDGVADGVLSDPRRCAWSPDELVCKAGQDVSQCLTPTQAAALKTAYAPLRDPVSQKIIYRGATKSGENANFRGQTGGPDPVGFGLAFYKAFVYEDPNWDWHTMDYSKSVQFAQTVNELYHFDIASDMSEFRKSRSKLIEYEGWLDNNFGPATFVDRYEQVGQISGGVQQDYHRLFMVPGMMHCGGTDGATVIGALGFSTPPPVLDADHDLVSALEAWVEHGIAPNRLIATKYVGGDAAKGIAFQRPLCPYPQAARYKGAGNSNDASSFVCALPGAPTAGLAAAN